VGTLIAVVIYVLFTRAVTDWRTKMRRAMVEHDTNAVARAVDSLLNYETVKYFSAEQREAQGYRKAVQAYANAAVKNETSLAALNIGQSLITNLMMAAAMGYTVWGWSRGQFTTGDVVLVNTLLAQLFRPLDLLGMVYREIRQGLVDMEAMFGLIDTHAEVNDAPDAEPLIVAGGDVRFENVAFQYDPERKILHGVDIVIPAGRTLAVVGSSGAGKSTLARILFRFYDISGGQVTIDGQDIARVTQAFIPTLLDAARIEAGHGVLDVATGTGAAARAVRDRVGSTLPGETPTMPESHSSSSTATSCPIPMLASTG